MDNLLVIFWVSLSVATLVVNLLSTCFPDLLPECMQSFAKYGKLYYNCNKNRRKIKRVVEIPRSWISHCHLFGVLFNGYILYSIFKVYVLGGNIPAFIQYLLDNLTGTQRKDQVNASTEILVVLLMQFHVIRKLYESIKINSYSKLVKMDLRHYILGFVQYLSTGIAILSNAQGFNTKDLELHQVNYSLNLSNILNFNKVLGFMVFYYFSLAQHEFMVILANLRKDKQGKVVSQEHFIPRGVWFELVSCPHYFAEIMIYLGITLIMFGQNSTWLSINLYVLVHLTINAIYTHIWYKQHFSDYPEDRKAIIPYIM